MLYAFVSRRQSRFAARHVYDYSSVAGDLRLIAGAVGFRSEWRAWLSGHAQSTFAGGLCKLVRPVKGGTNTSRDHIIAGDHHTFDSGYSNRCADGTGNCSCDAGPGAQARETPETKAFVEK